MYENISVNNFSTGYGKHYYHMAYALRTDLFRDYTHVWSSDRQQGRKPSKMVQKLQRYVK